MAGRPPLRGCCCGCGCGRGGGGEAAAAASSAASSAAPAPAPAAPASSSSMNGGGVRCGEGRPGPKELRGVGGWPEAEATRISSPPSGVRGEDEADDEEADEEADEDEDEASCGDSCGAGGTATGPPSGDREGAVAAAEVAAAGRSRSRLRRGDVAGVSGPWGGMAAVGSSAEAGFGGRCARCDCEVMRNAVPRPPKARHFSLFSFSFSFSSCFTSYYILAASLVVCIIII